MKNRIVATLLALIAASGLPAAWGAPFTAFTYQGRVYDNGTPATGLYDLTFKLYNTAAGGFLHGTLTQAAVPTTNGLFTVALDYGPGKFDGGERWLEIAVQSNGVPPFQTMNPRQQLTSTPYAIYTDRAGIADVANQAVTVAMNGVPTLALQPNAVTGPKIADGSVVRSVNGLTDNLTLAAGANITLGTLGNTLTISGTGGGGSAWLLGGNGGTTPGVNFLGTTDNKALDVRVNNARALSLDPRPTTANLIGGHVVNGMSPNADAAVIGGGGSLTAPNYIGGLYSNSYAGVFSGLGNTNRGSYSVIAGGDHNLLSTNDYVVLGGGKGNIVQANAAVLAGGESNFVQGPHAAIVGGKNNNASGDRSFVGGGGTNTAAGVNATVTGGRLNYALGDAATIAGGVGNQLNADQGTISGGQSNRVDSQFAFIGGGSTNRSDGQSIAGVIGGGANNRVRDGRQSSILGGADNAVTNGYYSAILGGRSNFLASIDGQGLYPDYAAILGGQSNTNTAKYATILGGQGVLADKYGQIAFGSKFATNGDAQASFYHLHGSSVANATSEVFLDGVSAPLVLATNSAWSFNALVVGKTVGGTFEFAGFEVKGLVLNDVGTLYVYPTTSALGSGVGTFTVTAAVDQARQALIFRVSCSNTGTTQWSVQIRTAEIIVPGASPI